MIERLGLKNFQSHKQTVLEFEEGVNVIIGPSDSGKTSIIRALRWIAWNRPLGDAFRSNWGGDTSAVIKFSDGNTIERLEADNSRHYRLMNPEDEYGDGNELIFEKFGTDVPDEVQQALNLSEINLQEQMDSPFLISDNPGEVSRHFNKVARIDQIDTSLRNVESWIRSINQDISSTEQEIERYEEALEEFAYLEKMEADIEVLESLENRLNKKRKQFSQLKKLISNITGLKKQIKKKSKLLPAKKPVNLILNYYDQKDQLQGEYNQLKKLLTNLSQLQGELNEVNDLLQAKNSVESILGLYNKTEQIKDKAKRLHSEINLIKGTNKAVKKAKKKLNDLEQTWHEEAPETCPICDSKL